MIRSTRRSMYRWAAILGDIEALLTLKPGRIFRRFILFKPAFRWFYGSTRFFSMFR